MSGEPLAALVTATMSKLTYHGTDVDVRLGDEVLVKRVLWGERRGVVCYLPGECAPHPQFEIDGLSYWAIGLENGTVISWPYEPAEVPVSKRVRFERRGDPGAAAIRSQEELL